MYCCNYHFHLVTLNQHTHCMTPILGVNHAENGRILGCIHDKPHVYVHCIHTCMHTHDMHIHTCSFLLASAARSVTLLGSSSMRLVSSSLWLTLVACVLGVLRLSRLDTYLTPLSQGCVHRGVYRPGCGILAN